MSIASSGPLAGQPASFVAGSDPLSMLGSELAALQRRVEALETAHVPPRSADWPPPDHLIDQIKRLTQEMFPGEVIAEIDFDPSEPHDPWIDFWVTSDLEYARLSKLQNQWHQRVESLGLSDPTRFCLLVSRP